MFATCELLAQKIGVVGYQVGIGVRGGGSRGCRMGMGMGETRPIRWNRVDGQWRSCCCDGEGGGSCGIGACFRVSSFSLQPDQEMDSVSSTQCSSPSRPGSVPYRPPYFEDGHKPVFYIVQSVRPEPRTGLD